MTNRDDNTEDMTHAREVAEWAAKLVKSLMAEGRGLSLTPGKTIPYTTAENRALRGAISTVLARVEIVRQRVEALEAKAFDFQGAFEPGKAYGKGAVVQHKGHLWISKTDTALEPGGNQHWQLIVRGNR